MTFLKSRDSNAKKKCGLCQKLRRALNHVTAIPKYHQSKQFNQQSKIILNLVKQFQHLKKKSRYESIPLFFFFFFSFHGHCLERKQKHNGRHKRKCI